MKPKSMFMVIKRFLRHALELNDCLVKDRQRVLTFNISIMVILASCQNGKFYYASTCPHAASVSLSTTVLSLPFGIYANR